MSLSYFGLEQYILSAPRTSFVSANKEGLVSLTGYLSLHFLGLSAGTLILPSSPKSFSRYLKHHRKTFDTCKRDRVESQVCLTSARQNDKTAIEILSYSLLWWVLFGITYRFPIFGQSVSRRMANIQYVFWVAALNTTVLFGCFLLDLLFFPQGPVYSQDSKLKIAGENGNRLELYHRERPPSLLDAINKNGFIIFLVANIATGLINLLVPTMYIADPWAVVILSAYAAVLCMIAWVLRERRLLQL